MTIDNNKFYMNPVTGSVDTGENWKADQKDIGFPISDLDSLVAVEKLGNCWATID
jgi:hypothetical protein